MADRVALDDKVILDIALEAIQLNQIHILVRIGLEVDVQPRRFGKVARYLPGIAWNVPGTISDLYTRRGRGIVITNHPSLISVGDGMHRGCIELDPGSSKAESPDSHVRPGHGVGLGLEISKCSLSSASTAGTSVNELSS
jgi:hypothetical protein